MCARAKNEVSLYVDMHARSGDSQGSVKSCVSFEMPKHLGSMLRLMNSPRSHAAAVPARHQVGQRHDEGDAGLVRGVGGRAREVGGDHVEGPPHSVGPKTRGSVLATGTSFVAHVPTFADVGLNKLLSASTPEGFVQHPSFHCTRLWLCGRVQSSGEGEGGGELGGECGEGGGLGDWQPPQVSLQFCRTFFVLHLSSLLRFVHNFWLHTSAHEPVTARARPGDLESEEPSRLAFVDALPLGNTQMRSSSTCIAEDERLDPFSATRRKRGERGACKRCVRSGRR